MIGCKRVETGQYLSTHAVRTIGSPVNNISYGGSVFTVTGVANPLVGCSYVRQYMVRVNKIAVRPQRSDIRVKGFQRVETRQYLSAFAVRTIGISVYHIIYNGPVLTMTDTALPVNP